VDPGIDRGATQTPEPAARRVSRSHLSIHVWCRPCPEWIRLLPRHHPKRKPKWPYRTIPDRIKNRTGLEQRPKGANTRRECGHWEADVIVAGDRQHGLNVLVDRKSRLPHISILPNKTAAATKQVMHRRLRAYPASLTQSITYDRQWP